MTLSKNPELKVTIPLSNFSVRCGMQHNLERVAPLALSVDHVRFTPNSESAPAYRTSGFQSCGERTRVLKNGNPIGPALALIGRRLRRQHWRYHGVDFQSV
jgi:hypothetical protein